MSDSVEAKPIEIVVNCKAEANRAMREIKENFLAHGWTRWTATFGETRTQRQNRTLYAIYTFIAKYLGDQTSEDIKCQCKLDFGVPIMLENEKFRNDWNQYFDHMTYEEQLRFMGGGTILGPNGLPVTSKMSRKQFNLYLSRIVDRYPLVSESDILKEAA